MTEKTSSTDRKSTYQDLMAVATERELTAEEIALGNGFFDSAAAQPIPLGLEALMGVRYLSVGPRKVALVLEADARHLQPAGLINGGVFAVLGETAGSIAGFIAAGADRLVVGANNSTDFFRPGKSGDTVTSTAEPVHIGRTSQVWEIRHENGEGKLLARTNLRLAVLPK